MKKIYLSILSLGLVFTSCDMNLNEPGTITDTESIKTALDCRAYRNNMYSNFRAITSGTYVYYSELEMDQFLGMAGNGNRGLYFSNANLTSSYSDLNTLYNAMYTTMKGINFFLEHGPSVAESSSATAEEKVEIARYIAEAKFFRAYNYYFLLDHYCKYNSADLEKEGLGCQLVTKYEPTGDTSKYPGRSSLKATLVRINDDLTDAFNGLVEYEKTDNSFCSPNASYLSSYAVAALQARVALITEQYQAAIDKATYVIGNTKYALAEGDDYYDMWATDASDELIMVPFVDSNESSYVSSINDGWNYWSNFPQRIDYAPTSAVINYYDQTNDIRFDSFFYYGDDMDFGDLGSCSLYVFAKFPGNNSLISGQDYFKNKPKPFRLSEQYLILAEANNALSKDTEACKALNKIRAARIDGYTDVNLTGNALRDAIRQERAKELIGEGFRMSDLRRWGLGFSRESSYPMNPEAEGFFIPSTVTVKFEPNDYRYIWPIPYDEMQVNPQLKGQQNPGYAN